MTDDVTAVKEALAFYGDPDSYVGHEQVVLDAARRYVHMIEIGPDYEAAAKVMWNGAFGEPWEGKLFVAAKAKVLRESRSIVDAALADYPSGETE